METNRQMIALHTKRQPGLGVLSWLAQRNPDEAMLARRRLTQFQYGSYRPSDRAAILLDASPVLTPYADDLIAAAD
jgi:hypothetical protein